jgi:uncharacterized protein (DUF302 family)
MLFELATSKPYPEIDAALRAAAERYRFGILGVHDLRQTMNNKGVDFEREVYVYEVCNPHQAKAVLMKNGAVSTVLPCRISVYRQETGYRVATMLPTAMMQSFGTPELQPVAEEVESILVRMIEETV